MNQARYDGSKRYPFMDARDYQQLFGLKTGGSFKVIQKISSVAYKLHLSYDSQIDPIIFLPIQEACGRISSLLCKSSEDYQPQFSPKHLLSSKKGHKQKKTVKQELVQQVQ